MECTGEIELRRGEKRRQLAKGTRLPSDVQHESRGQFGETHASLHQSRLECATGAVQEALTVLQREFQVRRAFSRQRGAIGSVRWERGDSGPEEEGTHRCRSVSRGGERSAASRCPRNFIGSENKISKI